MKTHDTYGPTNIGQRIEVKCREHDEKDTRRLGGPGFELYSTCLRPGSACGFAIAPVSSVTIEHGLKHALNSGLRNWLTSSAHCQAGGQLQAQEWLSPVFCRPLGAKFSTYRI
jgi:hypothetical protein